MLLILGIHREGQEHLDLGRITEVTVTIYYVLYNQPSVNLHICIIVYNS